MNPRIRTALLSAAVGICALSLPASAGAATVVNGGFETGTLQGWSVERETEAGDFFANAGTTTPYAPRFEEEEAKEFEECEAKAETEVDPAPCIKPPDLHIFAPPSGLFAGVSDEFEESSQVLYQDVALEPYYHHTLSMTLYYKTYSEIVVPKSNTLEVENPDSKDGNQQFRVDVLTAGTAPRSVNPSTVLATVFATRNGSPETMVPTRFSIDLTPFAGQTVRIRVAVAVTDAILQGGVDDVAITSTPPANTVKRGKLKLNEKKGTGSLKVTVPGAGVLRLTDGSKKGKPKLLKPSSVTTTAAGTVKLPLAAKSSGRKALREKGKLKVKGFLSFTPTGGTPGTTTFKATLKKTQ